MTDKLCRKCNRLLPREAFPADGFSPCRDCRAFTAASWYARRKRHLRPARRTYMTAWRAAHPDYMTEYWQTHERPRKPQDAAKRAAYMKAYMRRRRQRHDAIDRGQSIDYAADKRRRFAAILARVGK